MAAIHLGIVSLKPDVAPHKGTYKSLYNSIWAHANCVSLGDEQVALIAWLITPPHWTTD